MSAVMRLWWLLATALLAIASVAALALLASAEVIPSVVRDPLLGFVHPGTTVWSWSSDARSGACLRQQARDRLLMNWVTCPGCQAKLNAFHLAAPESQARQFWSSLRGIVECPDCHAHIRQQPRGGFVSGLFFLGGFVLASIGVLLGVTFEVLLAILFLWTAGIVSWMFRRKWVVVP